MSCSVTLTFFSQRRGLFAMAPKKGKKKKSGKKRKSAKGPAVIDGISTEEMSKEQLEQHIHRLREGKQF